MSKKPKPKIHLKKWGGPGEFVVAFDEPKSDANYAISVAMAAKPKPKPRPGKPGC